MILLEKLIHGRPYRETPDGPRFRPCVPNSVLARLGDKWTILVMSHLAVADGHRLRFSAMMGSIEGITQRMLTLTLRNLERDGLLTRHYFSEVPPRVEYELTAMGASMLPALEGFTSWIKDNWPMIETFRRAYDERNPDI
jgi:DNA-binding HxlR family transcriptional regulator